jgi:hypothetical protein
MSDKAAPAPRFLVRQGFKGWMVYDRQRKGPVLIGTNPAVNLTKEKAELIVGSLADPKHKIQIERRFH